MLDSIVARVDADWRPLELEALLLERADEHRAGGTGRVVPLVAHPPEPTRIAIEEVAGELVARAAADDDEEAATGTMVVGPNPSGSYVRMSFDPEVVPVGGPLAPLALAFWRFADTRLGLGLDAAVMSCAGVVAAGSGRR